MPPPTPNRPTAVSARGSTTAQQVAGRSAREPLPLVGRATELATLGAALAAADGGRGGTVFLVGESGIGKSRLAAATGEQATQRGFTVAVGRAYPTETGVPYALFSDALFPILRDLEPAVLTLLTRGGAAELLHLFPALDTGARPAAAVRGDPAEVKARLLWNFAQFLSRFSAKHPLLLVLENLQFADRASLELLHFVARQIASDRLLLVCTHNDPGEHGRSALRSAQHSLRSLGAADVLTIPPLTEQAVTELVQRVLGVSDDAPAFGSRLHRWTGGNPFFVEETLKTLVAGGQLSHASDGAAWDIATMAVPRTIRESVLARIGERSEHARTVADLVAVLGSRATHDALAAVSGMDADLLLPAVDELRASSVLSETERDGEIVYELAHPIFAETVYSELGLARARALHGNVGEALEVLYGDDAIAHADELAYHYARADARHLASKAVRYLHAAGRNASAKNANREGAEYLSTALTLCDRDDAPTVGGPETEVFELVQDLARVRQRLGDYDESLALWARALDAAERYQITDRIAPIRRSMGLACYWSGAHAQAIEHYDAAIRAAIAGNQRHLEARVHIAKATSLQAAAHRDDAAREVERALAIAEELGDPGLLARVHRALLLLYVWTGPVERAHAHGQRAIELSMGVPEGRGVAWSTHWALAMLSGLTGRPEDVRRHLSEANRLADELRSPLLRVWTAEVEIELDAGAGEWDRAIALAERTIATARALGQRTLLPRLLVWLGLVHLGRGDIEQGKRCVDEAWELAGASDDRSHAGDVHSIVPAHIGRAGYYLAIGDHAHAIRVGERGLAIADRSGYVAWAIHRLMPIIAEASLWANDLERAKLIGARLRRESTLVGQRLGLAWADACDALVELVSGDSAKAITLLRGAAEALEAIPYVVDAGRVRRQLGRALAESGDHVAAARELKRAHEIFAHLGAQRELDGTREQLRELGARPPARVTPGGGGLTGRELEIIKLVVARRSNKEIGKALGISARTASTHLSNIFAKLGVGSRGELVDVARESGVVGSTRP